MTFPVRLRTSVLVLGLAFALAALSVHLRGALVSGVGSLNDEPAHYATSMMARDYLRDGVGPGRDRKFFRRRHRRRPHPPSGRSFLKKVVFW